MMNKHNNDKLTKVVRGLKVETILQEINYKEDWKTEIENKSKYLPKFQPLLTRNQLRQLILRKLDYADRHAVYIMIDRLLGHGFILNNPTSQLSAQKRKIMPTNDTRYFLDPKAINNYLEANYHTHTTTTLDQFDPIKKLNPDTTHSSSF
jgi:hypothetical protein